MDFSLSEDQQIMRNAVREFVAREVIPFATEWDEAEAFPTETVARLGDMGVLGMVVPEEYGGTGLDYVTIALVLEELARGDGSLALTVASHNSLCTKHIAMFASDEQKAKYLPELATGKRLGAWCLTEPGSGSDASGMKTRAIRKDGGWLLNGTKMFITQGSVGGVYLILANTTPEKHQKGITAFVLPRETPGLSAGKHLKKLGVRSSDTTEVVLEDVFVGDDAVVGELDHGFIDTLQILDRGRIAIAAMGVGIARGSLEEALKYSTERQQFGRAIAEFQGIQWMLADMAVEVDAARQLTWHAGWMHDTGKPFGKEASMAKLYAAQVAMRAATNAIQIHGGYGYTREYPVERYLRDAKLCEIGEGTNEVQRMVIARHLLKSL
ncbi:MAG: acyl-CoA dehydrogenase family protein [Deltaproteobacteria bacterium]|nr:acyl-CoA dehydrogenase family protein [Deltaproteobacteria bacterium]